MKYTLINNEKYFFRKESTGAGILCVKEYGYQIFLNKTGSLVLDLLKEFNDTDQILIEMKRMFPDVECLTLKKDLDEILDLFRLYNLIDFEDNIDDMDLSVAFAGDPDYRSLGTFIAKNFKSNKYNFSQVDSANYYSPVSLRYRTFHSQEYYIIKKIKGRICSVLSVLPPNGISNVLSISSLIASSALNKEDVELFIENAINLCINKIPNQISKVRINVLGNIKNPKNKLLEEIFGDCGFSYECTLKNEINNKDITMLTKFI